MPGHSGGQGDQRRARVRHSLRLTIPALMLASMLAACDEGGPPPWNLPTPFLQPTSPESVVVNLQLSYRRRDIEEYAKLLAPEFIYKFQTADYDAVPKGFWTRTEDSVGTHALFWTAQVQEIRIDLLGLPAQPSSEVDHPPGAVKIRIVETDLQVDQTDGITWLASDDQDMFFRRGLASAGEDTTHWFLFEWRDLEIGGFSSPGEPDRNVQAPASRDTWGRIKAQYLE